jgi:hypothetical protein
MTCSGMRLRLAFLSLLLASHCNLLAQQTTYTFIGTLFDQFYNTSCPPICLLSGSFTVSQPLAPNLVENIGGSGDFTPTAFSFSDGVTTFTQHNSPVNGFAVDTDSLANITFYSSYTDNKDGITGLFTFYDGTGYLTQEGTDQTSYQAYFSVQDAPGGGWTIKYSQADPRWGGDQYDDYPGKTMAQKGCALTSLAMGIDIAGSAFSAFIDPGDLNELATEDGDFDGNHNLLWQAAVESVQNSSFYNPSNVPLAWNGVNATTPAQLATALQSSAEGVVVAVPGINKCAVKGTIPKGHFVLVTGATQQPDGSYTFSINDPGCQAHKTLEVFPQFSARGYVSYDVSDMGSLTFDGSPSIEISVSDSDGRQTGFTGLEDKFDIPSSYYYRDSITDLDTGDNPTSTTHYSGINRPPSGGYILTVVGMENGPYSVAVNAESTDGSRQPRVSVSGYAVSGVSYSYLVNYSSMPGSRPFVTRLE